MIERKKIKMPAAVISRDERCIGKVFQEVIIHRDGSVEIEWIDPAATPLVLEIWDAVNAKQFFPVRVDNHSRIYCG